MHIHLGKKMSHVNRQIHRCINARVDQFGITGLQSHIINHIQKNRDRDIYQKDIEEEFDIRRSSVTSVLQTMEKNGLIERVSVEQDARLKKIVLTPKAIKLASAIKKSIHEFENQLAEGITDDEIETFLTVLNKITNNMND